MRRRGFALLLACACAFAACGGDGGSNDDAEAGIKKAITVFVSSDNSADCWRFTTPSLLEKLSKTNYEVAVASCEALAINPLVEDAKKVTVTEIEVDGDAATATASFVGSVVGGQTARFGLVERDGRWMNDEIFGFVDLDAEKLATEWGRLLLLLSVTPEEIDGATCVMNRLLALSGENLEAMYLGGDPGPYVELVQSCANRSSAI